MDYDKILRAKTNNLEATLLPLSEVVGAQLLTKWSIKTGGISFWSDRVKLPRDAAFVFNAETGKIVRGGKFIQKVTDAVDLHGFPWPSKDDDPYCASVNTCATYINLATFERALGEIRNFFLAGLGKKGKFILVEDYPVS